MDSDSALKVGRHLVIPPAELEWRFSASGGPGGQHANTANTRVELVFDVAGSAVLGPRQRARLLERLGPSVRVVERLAERLTDALRVDPSRRPTVPTRASRERRLRAKQLRSARKVERRTPPPDA